MPLILGVVIVIVGGLALVPLQQVGQLKQQVAAKQQQVASLTAENAQLQQQAASTEKDRRAAERRLQDLQKEFEQAQQESSKTQELQQRYELLKDESSHLEQRLGDLTRERDEAKAQMMRAQEAQEDLEHAVARLRNRLALVERDYQRVAAKLSQHDMAPAPSTVPDPASAISQSATTTPSVSQPAATNLQAVELPPIVVRQENAAAGQPPVRGRLLDVNQAHRFVVIDQGVSQGVWVGMPFDILRDGQRIGQAVAVRIRSHITACDLVAAHELPKVGDLVVQRGP